MAALPRVTLCFAQSIDGRIATRTGEARGLSCDAALRFAHELRAQADAILVGSGTALADDPQLTVRHATGKNPLRVVLDARGRLPASSRLARDGAAPTVHVVREGAPACEGVERVVAPPSSTGEGVDLRVVLALLRARGVEHLLVEGGKRVLTSFFATGLFDRAVVAIAPIVVGDGVSAVGDLGTERLASALRLVTTRSFRLGDDVVIELERRSS